MLATLQEAGIGAPKFQIMEAKPYLEMLNATLREQGKPELDEAPLGHFDPVNRTFFVNGTKLPQSSAVAMETIAHETGHDFYIKCWVMILICTSCFLKLQVQQRGWSHHST